MDKFELIKRRGALEHEYLEKYKRLSHEYADEHCPAKVGDIVRGASGWIRVERITYSGSLPISGKLTMPHCVLQGKRVLKDGTPYKNGSTGEVFPWTLREVNGKKVKYEWE